MTASRRPPPRRGPGAPSRDPTPGEITRDQTLQQSRDLLVAITEGTGDAVFAKDLSGRYLMMNTIAARLLGTTVEAVVGHTDEELWPPEIVRRFRESDALRRVFEGVVAMCIAAGLVGGEAFSVDASLIKADVDKKKRVAGDQPITGPMGGEAWRTRSRQ